MRYHLIRLASAAFRLPPSVWLGSVDKNYGPILAVCGPKFMKFCDNVGDLSCFPMSLPDCIAMMFFVKKTFAIKSRSRRKTDEM